MSISIQLTVFQVSGTRRGIEKKTRVPYSGTGAFQGGCCEYPEISSVHVAEHVVTE